MDFAAVLLQPFAMCFVIRHHILHVFPEFWRMVHLFQVRQFMNNHVIYNDLRQQQQFGSEGYFTTL